MKLRIISLITLLFGFGSLPVAFAQSEAFTYNGQLNFRGAVANGNYDLQFSIFDSEKGGLLVKGPIPINNQAIVNGLLSVRLDFGATVFTGPPRWLEIAVAPVGGAFTLLNPRQEVTSSPYAIRAQTAGSVANGTVVASQLNTGGVAPAVGQFLSYKAGGLFWSDPGVATGGVFSRSGSDAYYTAGNIGIGTNLPSPGVRLEINGNVRVNTGGGGGFIQIGTPNGETGISFQGTSIGANNRADIRYDGNILKLVAGTVGPPNPANGITINPAGDVGIGRSVLFGAQTRQMLNLYGAGFGIGIQAAALYYRSGAGFAWHVGGQHSDATYDSGGGTTAMTLDLQGLKFGARLGQQLWLWSDPANTRYFGIGIQDSTLYNRCGNGGADGFVWYKGGGHNNAYHNGGGGQLLMSLDSSGLSVATLTIRGGADLAEPFELSRKDIAKGSVVIIDSENEGKLRLSEQSYDQRVAGVVSGANGVNPGISLRQEGVLEGSQNVALSGRVYVLADAATGAIKPGDLLTTSDTPGHAMKVGDHSKARGAILGKAMSGLKEGKGLVLVLVTLQ